MEKENNFLEKVSQLFLEYGAKSVTMDDIAKELGMSKKTLYQQYKNKEALLEEVLIFGMERVLRRMYDLDEEMNNAVERMFCRDEALEKTSRTNDSVFLKQLIKYYPLIFNRHMRHFSEKFSEILVQNIERGRKQGFYRNNFDAHFYAKLFFQLIMSYDSSPFLDTSGISRDEYRQETMKFYMYSIVTEKGREILEEMDSGENVTNN